jgi:dimethylamine monooxygenase subunit A
VMDDPTLFQPTGKWRTAHDATITQQNAGERLYLRVERQTLRRLPVSGAVLFGIRVHVYPLARAVTSPEAAAILAEAVRALPVEMAHYKSLPMFQEALLAWLDRHAG